MSSPVRRYGLRKRPPDKRVNYKEIEETEDPYVDDKDPVKNDTNFVLPVKKQQRKRKLHYKEHDSKDESQGPPASKKSNKSRQNKSGPKSVKNNERNASHIKDNGTSEIVCIKDTLPPRDPTLPNYQYYCYECEMGFDKEEDIKGHIRKNHKTDKISGRQSKLGKNNFIVADMTKISDKLWECNVCKIRRDEDNLKIHYLQLHRRIYECSSCKTTFSNFCAIKNHVKEIICAKRWDPDVICIRDQLPPRDQQLPDYEYWCEECNEGFIADKDIISHVKKWHNEEWITKKTASIHRFIVAEVFRVKTSQDLWECNMCQTQSTNLLEIKLHYIREHRKIFKCKKCNKYFSSYSWALAHKENCVKVENQTEMPTVICLTNQLPPRDPSLPDFEFWCHHCNKGMEIYTTALRHVQAYHKNLKTGAWIDLIYQIVNADVSPVGELWKCKLCEEEDTLFEIKKHYLTCHRRRYKCSRCPLTFVDSRHAMRHVKRNNCRSDDKVDSVHEVSSPEVELSQELFAHDPESTIGPFVSNDEYYSSVIKKLGKVQTYYCEDCEYGTNIYSEIHYHVKTLHPETFKKGKLDDFILAQYESALHDPKMFKCKLCSFMKRDLSIIKRHYKQNHRKIFQCPECDARFSAQNGLYYHQDITHKTKKFHGAAVAFKFPLKPPGTVFLCYICKRRFTSLRRVCWHQKRTHGMKSRIVNKIKVKKPAGKCYQCSKCKQRFTYRFQLSLHKDLNRCKLKTRNIDRATSSHDPENNTCTEILDEGSVPVDVAYQCVDCPYVSYYISDAIHHFQKVHSELVVSQYGIDSESDSNSIACKDCGVVSCSLEKFYSHIVVHHQVRPITCVTSSIKSINRLGHDKLALMLTDALKLCTCVVQKQYSPKKVINQMMNLKNCESCKEDFGLYATDGELGHMTSIISHALQKHNPYKLELPSLFLADVTLDKERCPICNIVYNHGDLQISHDNHVASHQRNVPSASNAHRVDSSYIRRYIDSRPNISSQDKAIWLRNCLFRMNPDIKTMFFYLFVPFAARNLFEVFENIRNTNLEEEVRLPFYISKEKYRRKSRRKLFGSDNTFSVLCLRINSNDEFRNLNHEKTRRRIFCKILIQIVFYMQLNKGNDVIPNVSFYMLGKKSFEDRLRRNISWTERADLQQALETVLHDRMTFFCRGEYLNGMCDDEENCTALMHSIDLERCHPQQDFNNAPELQEYTINAPKWGRFFRDNVIEPGRIEDYVNDVWTRISIWKEDLFDFCYVVAMGKEDGPLPVACNDVAVIEGQRRRILRAPYKFYVGYSQFEGFSPSHLAVHGGNPSTTSFFKMLQLEFNKLHIVYNVKLPTSSAEFAEACFQFQSVFFEAIEHPSQNTFNFANQRTEWSQLALGSNEDFVNLFLMLEDGGLCFLEQRQNALFHPILGQNVVVRGNNVKRIPTNYPIELYLNVVEEEDNLEPVDPERNEEDESDYGSGYESD